MEFNISKINKNVNGIAEAFLDFADKKATVSIYSNVDLEDYRKISKETTEEFRNSKYSKYSKDGNPQNVSIKRVRGVMSHDGTLFSISPQYDVIHEVMVDTLTSKRYIKKHSSWWTDTRSLGSFLCVETTNGRGWQVSESYSDQVVDDESFFEYFNHYEANFKKRGMSLTL